MILRMRWPFFAMAVMLLLFMGGGAAAYYTGFFNLHRVSVSPEKYADQASNLDSVRGKNIFGIPFDQELLYFISEPMVQSASLKYEFPDAVAIDIEEAKPLALAIAQDGQSIYALDERGRVILRESQAPAFELPIITGLKDSPLYTVPKNPRLRLIIPQLLQIRKDHQDFYRLISSIDLSAPDSVTVKMDGMSFIVIMFAGEMCANCERLRQFLLDINPDLKDVIAIDMRSEKQIIATRKKCQKQS
ncbi:hypothetical protein TRIP_C20893 [Candidatus Zixiibacteriota bacterium]|nr:hypothetical protein TRIP_C20893 [candidate division Zixibacteria bacterium]